MDYLEEIIRRGDDPAGLETLYRAAGERGEAGDFELAMAQGHERHPDNILYAAWFHRLEGAGREAHSSEAHINWKLAIPLSLICGLLFGLLMYLDFTTARMPHLMWLAGPISAGFIVAFLAIAGRLDRRQTLASLVALAGITGYAYLIAVQPAEEGYRTLMLLHLPALAWIAVGAAILGLRARPEARFAALVKSIEVLIVGGLFVIAGGVLAGITMGLFEAVSMRIPDRVFVSLVAGGGGLIPVLAVAATYDPALGPARQQFEQGLSKIIATLMRIFLPLSLLVLGVYVLVIPFRFMEPFHNRDVLIVYNVMLFAVLGLLVGASPARTDGLSPKQQSALRAGILALASLTALVSLYALAAISYRTALGGITMNRLTVIGWNGLNIGILASLIVRQMKRDGSAWLPALHSTFSAGTIGYAIWTLFLILSIPLLF